MSKKQYQNQAPVNPPTHFDLELEMSFLGNILVSGSHSLQVMDEIADTITYEMFHDLRHQQVFSAMWILWQSKIEIDTLAILDILRENKNEFEIKIGRAHV